MGTEIVLPAHL